MYDSLNMVRRSVLWLGVVCLTAMGQTPEFTKDILPVLTRYCGQCHSGASAMGKLDIRSVDAMLAGGAHGPALVKGSASKSLLYTRIADRSMPMGDKKVGAAEAKLIRDWIDAGAPAAMASAAKAESKPSSSHWAFTVPRRPVVPTVRNASWVKTPVDAFVLARLQEKGIQPVAAADKLTLLRRVYLDLIGLPPTPAEQQSFLTDTSAEAYDRVVERLLGSPQYGERWARHWLDVVRYAESNGYERDGTKPHAWRYRDWVIDSLNRDKGYDRFVTEQLAGDEVEGSNAETQIATTFLRLGTWDDEPAEPTLDRYDQLDDVLGTTAATFLGVTLRCARCHDHKFEPFSQKDYYRTLAIFQPLKRPQDDRKDLDRFVGTEAEISAYTKAKEKADSQVAELKGQIEKVRREVMKRLFSAKGKAKRQDGKLGWLDHAETVLAFATEAGKRTKEQKRLVEEFNKKLDELIQDEAASAERDKLVQCKREIARIDAARSPEPPRGYIWFEEGSQAPATRLLVRGDPSRPADEVEPGVPTILGKPDPAAIKPTPRSTGRRLWLARWMTSAENPLTARVMVNRVWQWHFGDGLVGTENDFGVIGQRPSHPELLDWLATEFRESGWSLKALHRTIVKSNTYQLSAAWDAEAGKKDPEASLLWRWRPRRLEAEVVRDVTLALSGELNPQMRGPSIYPDLPQAVLDGQSKPGDGWGKSAHEQSSRRSVYIFAKRSLAVPELEVLDAPDTTSSCEQRSVSTTGPQALTFLNGDFTQARAKRFAARLAETGDSKAQVARAFELALNRPATAQELAAAAEFLERQKRRIASELTAAGKDSGEASRRALESFAVTLLNTNEFFYVN